MEQRNVIKDIEENGIFKEIGIEFEKLGAGTPQSQITEGVMDLSRTLIIFSIIFIIAGISVAVFLGQSISKPITSIVSVLNRMSQYDIITERSSREICTKIR